jgi:hypothetical protein
MILSIHENFGLSAKIVTYTRVTLRDLQLVVGVQLFRQYLLLANCNYFPFKDVSKNLNPMKALFAELRRK